MDATFPMEEPTVLEREKVNAFKASLGFGFGSGPDEADVHLKFQKRMSQLQGERNASFPSNVLWRETKEELKRIKKAISNTPIPEGCYHWQELNAISTILVKKRWVEQGIWDNKWEGSPGKHWKHENEQLRTAPDAFFGEGADRSANFTEDETNPPKSMDELQKELAELRQEREALRQLLAQYVDRKIFTDREASRPFHQFIAQVSSERAHIEGGLGPAPAPNLHFLVGIGLFDRLRAGVTRVPPPSDVNTIAYERVKNRWKEWGIWNEKWGVMPGMRWPKEQSLENLLIEEFGPEVVAREFAREFDTRIPGLAKSPQDLPSIDATKKAIGEHSPMEAARVTIERPLFGTQQHEQTDQKLASGPLGESQYCGMWSQPEETVGPRIFGNINKETGQRLPFGESQNPGLLSLLGETTGLIAGTTEPPSPSSPPQMGSEQDTPSGSTETVKGFAD